MSKFWIDRLAEEVHSKFPEVTLHLSCGLSVRGPQHIGRIRGELCIPNGIKKVLEEKFGREVVHYLILYDMDAIKPKALKFVFSEKKQKFWEGVSLFNLEDPFGCHKNWVEHYWEDFGNYLEDFGFEVKIVKTSEFYRKEETRELVKWIVENREKVIEVVNRFRKRNPWPKDFIPLNPICEKCLSIAHTVAKKVEGERVYYECKKCGNVSKTSIENCKLNWRLEWPALWKILHIEFEPYGKDHAVAGGSRETCGIFSKILFNYEPPLGEWNEWVSLKVKGKFLGEMTASGFRGITPKQWLEIASPEILRFLYFSTRPHTQITIDLDNFFVYWDKYDRAERVYFGIESEANERERKNLIRSYELAQLKKRDKIPPQVPFSFATLVIQIVRKNLPQALEILRRSKHLPAELSVEDVEYVKTRLLKAWNWAKKYAPERFRMEIKFENKEMVKKLSHAQKEALKKFGEFLRKEREDRKIVEKIGKIIEEFGMEKKEFFEGFYLLLLGKTYGPRVLSIIRTLGEQKISEILLKNLTE